MERSLRFVLIGTFTLRFSTGLTGAMLGLYLASLPAHGGEPVDARVVGLFAATFYVAELVLSPMFGILSDRIGHHRVMLYGPVFGAIAVILTGLTTALPVLGVDASARGGVVGCERPVDPRVHRHRDRGERGPARQGRRALRGGDAGGARGGLHRRAEAVRGHRSDGVLPERR